MTEYQRQLLAIGATPEEATRADWANELVRFQNREHPSYGIYEPDPPSAEEVRQAYSMKYGSSRAA